MQALRALLQGCELLLCDLLKRRCTKRLKTRYAVDAPEKLRRKMLPQAAQSSVLRLRAEAEAPAGARAEVRGHHEHRVAEVDAPPAGIRQESVLHDLQQQAADVRVRLFQLVEQHKTVGPAAHTFGQLAALVVADVARRRADKARDREFFHIFRHIHADHCVFTAVNGLGQRLAQLRLADARRPEEQHGRRGALLLGKAASPAPHGLCRSMDGCLLPDDAGGERLLQRAQALPLRPGDRPDGNARAARNGCGDVLHGDRPAGLAAPPQTVAQGGGPLVFSGAHGGLQGLLLLRRSKSETVNPT